MRFKCFRPKSYFEAKVDALKTWHRFFVWLPMQLDYQGECVWLEFGERRYPYAEVKVNYDTDKYYIRKNSASYRDPKKND